MIYFSQLHLSLLYMKKYILTTSIDTVRHGEKDASGDLTMEGHRQSALKALALEHLGGHLHIYHSGADRVYRTVRMIKQLIKRSINEGYGESFEKEVIQCIGACNLPEAQIDTHVRNELHFLFNPNSKGTYFSSWKDQPTREEAVQRAQELLNYTSHSPEASIVPSPKQMAQRVASLLLEQLHAALASSLNEKNNYINGTHEPVILSFIAYVFNNFRDPDNTFMQSIGNAIDFVEGFHIKGYQSEDGAYLLTCSFRNHMTTFTLEELEAFVLEQ